MSVNLWFPVNLSWNGSFDKRIQQRQENPGMCWLELDNCATTAFKKLQRSRWMKWTRTLRATPIAGTTTIFSCCHLRESMGPVISNLGSEPTIYNRRRRKITLAREVFVHETGDGGKCKELKLSFFFLQRKNQRKLGKRSRWLFKQKLRSQQICVFDSEFVRSSCFGFLAAASCDSALYWYHHIFSFHFWWVPSSYWDAAHRRKVFMLLRSIFYTSFQATFKPTNWQQIRRTCRKSTKCSLNR